MSGKQTISGKSFEFAIASELGRHTNVEVVNDAAYSVARAAYDSVSTEDRDLLDTAAVKFAWWIKRNDSRLGDALHVRLLPDWCGKHGDARDVVISTEQGDIGISAKNNHEGIKASRLSGTIDFGKEWADCPVSNVYINRVRRVFNQLGKQRDQGMLFRDLPNKVDTVYLPVLTAFEDEIKRLCEVHREKFISGLFSYLLGRHDFYKVIKWDSNKTVSVQSMNLTGSLEWGRKWNIPQEVEIIKRKPNSNSTLLVSFSGGWQLSFRLHNASSMIEPSLKFDILFVGLPATVTRQEISLT